MEKMEISKATIKRIIKLELDNSYQVQNLKSVTKDLVKVIIRMNANILSLESEIRSMQYSPLKQKLKCGTVEDEEQTEEENHHVGEVNPQEDTLHQEAVSGYKGQNLSGQNVS